MKRKSTLQLIIDIKIWNLLVPVLFLFSCQVPDMIQKIDGSKIEVAKLDKSIQQLMDSAQVTGMTVTIFNENEIAFKKAYGWSNYEKKDSLQINQIFYGASLSKSVFGYLVAILAEEGVIDLDKPLQEYIDEPIPEMKFKKEWRGFQDIKDDLRYQEITARMCLGHTTGFPNWKWISRKGEFQPEGKLAIYFDPGTDYSYSGEGILLLQYIIERITGEGLETLAQEKIFKPLGMTMTSYVWQERFKKVYCNGHTVEQKPLKKDIEDEAGAAGSMETTSEDYATFMRHILNLTEENSPITQSMFKPSIRIRSKMQFGPLSLEKSNDNDEIELSYGLGWGLLKTPFGYGTFKEGHGEGFQHYSIIFPVKKIGILLLSNSDNAESIFKEVLDKAIGDKFTPWKWENYVPWNMKK